MDWLWSFFAHILLATAGLAVTIFWLVVVVAGLIELYDSIFNREDNKSTEPEEEIY